MLYRLLPRLQLHTLLALGTFFFSALATKTSAEPWIDAGDEQARHHIQVLVDGGHASISTSSWPLMWSSVSGELSRIDVADLTEQELWSYQYLRHELRRARRGASAGQMISVNSSLPGITDFAIDSREQWESRSYGNFTGKSWAGQLQIAVADDSIDGQRWRLDGSYLAKTWGNWALGAGAIDRWWGPGWQSSIILSNNARPSPGVFIQRVENAPFQLPVLEWLGPWDLHIFLNQLEGSRATPEAKLFGMRVTLRPFQSLEIGLSRTAQWGGDGRPEDISTFWDMLIGKDNRGEGLAEDGSDEPGNQLGGADWRLSHSIRGVAAAFYGQIIGEDEAGGLPSHVLGMAGLETSFSFRGTHNRFALEASNTTMEFNKGGTPNVAYEHPRYPSGYRYRGRPLGASTDNDSQLAVAKGFHTLLNGHQLNWTLGRGTINEDGTDRPTPSGNVFGNAAKDVRYFSVQYALPVGSNSQLAISGQYYSDTLHIRGETVETGVGISYKLRL